MGEITIYHNPRCGKSRKALELIRRRGIEPVVIEYLKNPPNEKQLADILERLGMTPRQILRTKEKEYKQLGLNQPAVTDRQLIRAIVKHPILLERPIVLSKGKGVLGRPPENVDKIL
jgi:arsenate reductase (glutaredoxin)